MNKKKLGMMLAAMGLVGVVAIGGTLAFLTADTNQVTNTFAMDDGYVPDEDKAAIDLYETVITSNGDGSFTSTGVNTTLDAETGIEGNNYTDVFPGSTMPKDPKVTLNRLSPDSRIYVNVTGIDELEQSITGGAKEFTVQYMNEDGEYVDGINPQWHKVSGGTGLNGLYVYDGDANADANDTNTDIAVDDTNGFTTGNLFDQVVASTAITQADIKGLNEKLTRTGFGIEIDAAVIQSANLDLAKSNAAVEDFTWDNE